MLKNYQGECYTIMYLKDFFTEIPVFIFIMIRKLGTKSNIINKL